MPARIGKSPDNLPSGSVRLSTPSAGIAPFRRDAYSMKSSRKRSPLPARSRGRDIAISTSGDCSVRSTDLGPSVPGLLDFRLDTLADHRSRALVYGSVGAVETSRAPSHSVGRMPPKTTSRLRGAHLAVLTGNGESSMADPCVGGLQGGHTVYAEESAVRQWERQLSEW